MNNIDNKYTIDGITIDKTKYGYTVFMNMKVKLIGIILIFTSNQKIE
jgi:hypothetical protein